ncbi:hypothetical protein SD074_04460 [Prolixibacter sp. SD074]|nr:hypothetical protein SD074_04460 [Prolixibacter sp. SD074]
MGTILGPVGPEALVCPAEGREKQANKHNNVNGLMFLKGMLIRLIKVYIFSFGYVF